MAMNIIKKKNRHSSGFHKIGLSWRQLAGQLAGFAAVL